MEEYRQLIKELLAEMEMSTPECIEEFRREWIAELNNKDPERGKILEEFVNRICEYGMARNKVIAV